MKIPVSELSNEQLDDLVPLARGWFIVDWAWYGKTGRGIISFKAYADEYYPSSRVALWGELLQVFLVDVLHNEHNVQAWACRDVSGADIEEPIDCFAGLGEDGAAICRAVIASVYGEYVEVEDNG